MKLFIKNINRRSGFSFSYVQKFSFNQAKPKSEKSQNSKNTLNFKEIQEKLSKEGSVKIYDSKYTFNSEKLLLHSSLVFLTISTTTIFFSQVSLLLKIVNFVFLFTPSLLIQIERLINKTRFIKTIKILPENKIEATNMWGKQEVISVDDLDTASNDPRVKAQKDYLNNELFVIFTNKKNTALYHVPRDGVYLNEDLFHNILEGKKI